MKTNGPIHVAVVEPINSLSKCQTSSVLAKAYVPCESEVVYDKKGFVFMIRALFYGVSELRN